MPSRAAARRPSAVTLRAARTAPIRRSPTTAAATGTAPSARARRREWMAAREAELLPVGKVRDQRLNANSVCNIVKASAASIGLDASTFGAHSLRSGFLTSVARRGASVFKMRDVSRHKSMDVLQAYVRDADLFRDHAGAGLL